MRVLFLLLGILFCLFTNAQYYGFPYYYIHSDVWYRVGDPIRVKCDTALLSDCSEYLDTGFYDCVYDIDMIWHYSDSSKHILYHNEQGKALKGKKYGRWFVENGYYKDSIRIRGNDWAEHYINDYCIPYADHVSDSIYYAPDNMRVICFMPHFGTDKFPDIMVKLEYTSNETLDTTFIKCSTMDDLEIFKTTTYYVEDEIKLLIDGYYNRKIYVR